MKRKVSVCMLRADSARGAAEYLRQKLAGGSPAADLRDFPNADAFAAGVAHACAAGGIVVAAAPLPLFLNAKLRILKASSTKIVRSSSILRAMGGNAPQDPKELNLFAAIPEKAKAIVSPDGLYSAFVKKEENCILIFLPLDESRLSYIFSKELDRIFSELFPAKPQPAPENKGKSGFSELRQHIESVAACGKTIAVSPCGCSKALLSAVSSVSSVQGVFIADSARRDRQEGEVVADYIAQCARISKENSGADFGLGISGIYNDNDYGDFVIVCLADSNRARAAKVYANVGETHKQLVAAAIIKLCLMISELNGEAELVNPIAVTLRTEKPVEKSKLPIIIAASCIAVAVAICIIIAVFAGGKKDSTIPPAGQNDYANGESNALISDDDNYYGGSGIDEFDMDAFAAQPYLTTTEPSSTGLFSSSTITLPLTSTTKTPISVTVTKLITTITQVVTAKQTAAPTTEATTVKPTVTKPTTEKTNPVTNHESSASQAGVTVANGSKGTFVFKVYGWGHGVGMSQDGAIKMAKDGSDYKEILRHYYIGTTIKTDSNPPADFKVKYGGNEIPLVEYLCRTTKREIGAGAPTEALKAQIVAVYTFAKWYNFDVDKSRHAYDSSYNYEGTNLHKACLAVLSMTSDSDTPKPPYVDYQGKAAFTCYFASAAGKTTSSDSVWGGGAAKYPYLIGGATSPEAIDASTVQISSEDMKAYIESYCKDNDVSITLGSDPATWLEILSHDSSYSSNVGYVNQMRIGNYTVRGNAFRSFVVDYKLRSHCFSFEYIPAE